MQLDSHAGRCTVPQDKLDHFLATAQSLLQQSRLSVKAISSAAGMLVSFKPAMPFAMMASRAYYEAISGCAWDSKDVRLTPAVREEMQWWLQRLTACNGSTLWSRAEQGIIASDASEFRYAAYTVSGQPAGFRWQLDFTPAELSLTQSHELGSTVRELTAIHRCIQTLLDSFPHHVQHAHLQWLSDSQSGVGDLTRMRAGTPELLYLVRRICKQAVEHDISFDWQWRPRDSRELKLADYYSKEPDTGNLYA